MLGEIAEAILRPRYIGGEWRRVLLLKLEAELLESRLVLVQQAGGETVPQEIPPLGVFREAAANVVGEVLQEIVARSPQVRIEAIALDANEIMGKHRRYFGLREPLRGETEEKYRQAWHRGFLNELRQVGMLVSAANGKLRFSSGFFNEWREQCKTNSVLRWMLDIHNLLNRDSREKHKGA